MDCSPPVSSVHGIFRQEYWSGSPCRPPGDLPDPGIEPRSPVSPALWADSLPPEPSGRFPASCCDLENLTWLFAHPTQCSRFCKLSSAFLMGAGKSRSGVSQGLSASHPTSPLHSSAGSPFSLCSLRLSPLGGTPLTPLSAGSAWSQASALSSRLHQEASISPPAVSPTTRSVYVLSCV